MSHSHLMYPICISIGNIIKSCYARTNKVVCKISSDKKKNYRVVTFKLIVEANCLFKA